MTVYISEGRGDGYSAMNLIEVENARKYYGGREDAVLDGVSVELRPGERVGLIGPNGCGKSTLLKIIAGQIDPDGGSVRLHPGTVVGYLEQTPTFTPGRTVYEEAHSALESLLALQREFEEVAHRLAESAGGTGPDADVEHQRYMKRFDFLQHEIDRHDAYNINHRTEAVLDGLEFPASMYDQPVDSLSGGEVNRLILAKLLLSDPDVLLLDEPSNHLDIDMTRWLETFLAGHRAAMIIVSHDRWFLDRTTNHTFELFHGTVDRYVGNFSAYRAQQSERILVQRRTWEKQQDEIAKMEDFVRRNHYGEKHAQAEDRRKKLERMERIPPPREIAPPAFFFPTPQRGGDVALRVEDLAKSYDRPLFERVTFDLLRGQRWAILGPNGCGKTTLLRCVLGEETPDAGRIVLPTESRIGYFDQHLATLDPEMEVADAVRPPQREMDLPRRRDHLARFGITGEDVFKRVGMLSGGERCRVALARIAVLEPNVLILDEPTNHLDLWARDALEKVLCAFGGTVLFISHDRYFVNQVADHLLVVEPGRWRVIDGNYETYEMLSAGGVQGSVAGLAGAAWGNTRGGGKTTSTRGGGRRASASPGGGGRTVKSPSGKGNTAVSGNMPSGNTSFGKRNGRSGNGSGGGGGRSENGTGGALRRRNADAAQRFQSLIRSPGPTGEDYSIENLPDAEPWDPARKVPLPPQDDTPDSSVPASSVAFFADASRRKRKYSYRKVEEIEADIATREKRIATIHELLTKPEVLRNGDRVQELRMELDSVQILLAGLYEHWEESMELNW